MKEVQVDHMNVYFNTKECGMIKNALNANRHLNQTSKKHIVCCYSCPTAKTNSNIFPHQNIIKKHK